LREEKGGEFIGNKWDAFLGEHGIRHENTVWATPQQNSVAEHKNHILAELITAALNEGKLPKVLWGEALCTVNCILNIAPSETLPADTTPYEQLERHKLNYSVLCVFGCHAFAHVGKDKHKSLDSHTTPCMFWAILMITRAGVCGILALSTLASCAM
jgi:hypothetical protein